LLEIVGIKQLVISGRQVVENDDFKHNDERFTLSKAKAKAKELDWS